MGPVSTSVRWIAIAAIVGSGVIHLIEARDAFGDATYKGMLFVAQGLGALVADVGIYRAERVWGWSLGLLAAGGALIGYVLSRTVGLPGLPPEPEAWLEPMGVASLIVEGLFVLLFVVAWRRPPTSTSPPS
jgi:peptidoglycan/LPS O-acetylase OafA/YrhL